MNGTVSVPAYNSRKLKMLFSSRVLGTLICFAMVATAFASDWRTPEAQLAGKIVAVTGPGVVALEVTSWSSISSADVEQIRAELTSLLANSGVRVWQPDQAAATIKLTLSENLQQYVWVAQIQQAANQESVVIVSVPRPASSVAAQNSQPLNLHATPVISEAEPILDFAVLEGSPRRLLVLGATAVTIHEFKDGRWLAGQSLPIKIPVPLPRDLRGRLFLRKDHLFDVFLPGLVCRSSGSAPLNMNCQQSDDPWPIQTEDAGLSGFFSPTRNFFTGALVPGILKQRSAPAFYSAAGIPRQNYTLWLFTAVDGTMHLLDGINDQVAARVHWGSDIAGVRSACRPSAQVVATMQQEDGRDSLQAFEVPDREPLAVSQKLPTSGNVTALWTSQAGDGITAVVRNSENGNYDALQISLSCAQ
jgi:hypothetical protein